MSPVPNTHKALVIVGKSVEVKEIKVHEIKDDEILVKTIAVAINPTDWKHIDWSIGPEGAVPGCEAVGPVVAVGKNVANVKIGQYVAGFISGANKYGGDVGAFSEYVAIKDKALYKFPHIKPSDAEGRVEPGPITTLEQAVSCPVGFSTALLAFTFYGGLKIKPDAKFKDQIFFVWGAASSLGQAVVQLAKYLGFRVFTTNSPVHDEWIKKFGAEQTFDYRDPDVIEKIKKAAGDNITYAYDAITEGDTSKFTYEVLSNTKPVTFFTSLSCDFGGLKEAYPNKDVKGHLPLAYLTIDKVKDFGEIFHSPPGMFEASAKFIADFNNLLAEKPTLFKAMPLEVLSGGFEAVIQGLDIVRKGKNRGLKVVVRL
jgi:NADPH:quinone reductase-like Zn-dependent oxidoreductase